MIIVIVIDVVVYAAPVFIQKAGYYYYYYYYSKKKNDNINKVVEVVKVLKVVKNSCNNVVVILDDGAGPTQTNKLPTRLRPPECFELVLKKNMIILRRLFRLLRFFKVVKNSCNNVVLILDDGAGPTHPTRLRPPGPPLLAA